MPRILFLFLLMIFSIRGFLQPKYPAEIQQLAKKSHWCAYYRVPADSMLKWVKVEQINIGYLNSLKPQLVLPGSVSLDSTYLPNGQYVWVNSNLEWANANWLQISEIGISFANGLKENRLLVYHQSSEPILSATVMLKGKPLEKSKNWTAFVLPGKKWEQQWAMVAAGGDTLIAKLEKEMPNQHWPFLGRRFRYWPVVRKVANIPNWVVGWFDGEPSPKRNRKLRKKYSSKGFVIFNQPIYKPGDTLKLKAWLTDGRENPLKEPQTIGIGYTKNGKYIWNRLGEITPSVPGSFVYTMALPDSFPSDTRYNLSFDGKREYAHFNAGFSIEDYKLPDISTFNFSANKDDYLAKDTLVLTAEATDASGLPLLDAGIEVRLILESVMEWKADTLFVPDTLYRETLKLNTDGLTTLNIPLKNFPAADLRIRAEADLRNSNNERKQNSVSFNLYQNRKEIIFTRISDSLLISWNENDVPLQAKAMLTLENDDWLVDTIVQLPCTIKSHPLAEDYNVYVLNKLGAIVFVSNYTAKDDGDAGVLPRVNPAFNKDSVGFSLYNPGKMDLFFTVYSGKKIIWEGTTKQTSLRWFTLASENKLYLLKYSYVHEGESMVKSLQMGLPYKWLQVNTETPPVVQPGIKDTLKVTVTDYQNRPVEGINLTAVAHNLQLKDKLNLPDLPLVHNYKRKKTGKGPGEVDQYSASLKTMDVLYPFTNIRKAIGTDTMQWYNWLYSTEPIQIVRSIIKSPLPEIAVHAQNNGVPQPLVIIYINNRPIWSNRVNTEYAYSHQVMPGFVKVGIRTRDKMITADSIYLQPFYKHDLFFNLDSLQNKKNIWVNSRPDTLINVEIEELSQYFIRLENGNTNQGAILWQGSRVHKLSGYPGEWIAGPFEPNLQINAWKKDSYHTKFPMESNYSYRIGQGLVRKEKMPLINSNAKMLKQHGSWRLGEETPKAELPPAPEVFVPNKVNLQADYKIYKTSKGYAKAQLEIDYDSVFSWQVWVPTQTPKNFQVTFAGSKVQHQLVPGAYWLLLVKNDGRVSTQGPYFFRENGTNCINIINPQFTPGTPLADSIVAWQKLRFFPGKKQQDTKPPPGETLFMRKGSLNIAGYVTDAETGIPIPGATVSIKGSNIGTSTNEQGYYEVKGIASGSYTLLAQSVGYVTGEKMIRIGGSTVKRQDFSLSMSVQHLDEVVVVGYGTQKKRALTSASVKVESVEMEQMLAGKVAGVQVTGNSDGAANIQIRGISSVNQSNEPLYVVDGVLMDGLPADIDINTVSVEVLKDAAATALYGSRGSNGVILVNTGRKAGPTLRAAFSDYAYWQPNSTTGKDGTARIPIQYPDNITNWQHAVYAAGAKGRYGKNLSTTKAFKAVQGQLSVPSFLIEGDSTTLVGKAMNYTDSAIRLEAGFKLGENTTNQYVEVAAMDAATPLMRILAPAAPDTLKPIFTVKDAKGRSDGEQRTIPVFEKGTKENTGSFFLLSAKDTTIRFEPTRTDVPVQLFATTKLIDLLDKELESLAAYPYDCLEQTANKLWGLMMIKEISKAKGEPFKYEKRMAPLQNKLLKNQQPDGGWGWWPGSTTNLYITTRVLQVLRQLPANDQIRKAIREGNLYLQNQLPELRRAEKIETLYSLSQGGHVYPYKMALDSIPFDSLSIHYQWQYYSTLSAHPDVSDSLWQKLWQARTESATGALYWGKNQWEWYQQPKATMVVAYRALRADSSKQHLLPRLQQYFLEEQQNGWGNTVEKAEICSILLQEAVRQNDYTRGETRLVINGDSVITAFPAKLSLPQEKTISVQKTGFGLVYLTLFQQWQNKAPEKVDSLFHISTLLVQQDDTVSSLIAGKPAMLKVHIDAKKSAQFVMVEIPIPAGCVVTHKPQVPGQHREYLKDKTVVFLERLGKGHLEIDIPLEVRYPGRYTLNPARIELMYIPVLFGREGMKNVVVQ